MQSISEILGEEGDHVVQKVVVALQIDPSLFNEVFSALTSDEPRVRSHTTDVLERISVKDPDSLYPYKNQLMEHATDDAPEVRFTLMRLLTRLPLSEEERIALFERVQTFLADPDDMVKVGALSVLIILAKKVPSLSPRFVSVLEEQAVAGIPANQDLAKYELEELATADKRREKQGRKQYSLRERLR